MLWRLWSLGAGEETGETPNPAELLSKLESLGKAETQIFSPLSLALNHTNELEAIENLEF
jgi:hypothetical protein